MVTQLAAQEGSVGIDCPSTKIAEANITTIIAFIVGWKLGERMKMKGVTENRNNHYSKYVEEEIKMGNLKFD